MSQSANAAVLAEVRGQVLLITLNRPEALNAIDGSLAEGLLSAVDRLDSEPDLVAGVLAGSGRGFCSGLDLKEFSKHGVPKGIEEFLTQGSTKPLIAAVEGFALAGGLEIGLTCDLLVAARGAKFGIPEAAVGLVAAGGALVRLPSRLPYGVAMEMALTAEAITAEQAHAFGLVSRLVDGGQAVAVALELAQRIARNAPLAVLASKQILQQSSGRPEAEAFELQASYVTKVFSSDDAREGALAFAERRRPSWSGT